MPTRILHFLSSAFLLLCVACVHSQEQTKPEIPVNSSKDYLSELKDENDFKSLQAQPLSEKFGNVKSVKLLYDISAKKIYFINSRRYQYHYSFVYEYLKTYEDLQAFNNVEYSLNKGRHYLLSNLNYFSASGKYVLDFFADDEFSQKLFSQYFSLLKTKLFFGSSMKVFANNAMRSWPAIAEQASFISESEIFGAQQFQPLVKGTCFGYLKLYDGKNLPGEKFTGKEIVVTSKMPLDLPDLSGIITAQFQTPLSHVNILAHARNIPNCAMKNILSNPEIGKLNGMLVKMVVTNDTVLLSAATVQEAGQSWKKKKRTIKTISLKIDTSIRLLTDISWLSVKNIGSAGGKAAHFGELAKIKLDGKALPLPENAFAIPMYFYFQHLQRNNINPLISSFLQNDSVKNDPALCDAALKQIRAAINDAAIDAKLVNEVKNKLRRDQHFNSYRFRSSTNAEDIKDFSGAGLYESRSGSLTDPEKPVENAIRKVWASLWLPAAFYERQHVGIDQRTVGMAILVHRAFGTEAVNGVAITKDLYRPGYPSFTVNAQLGETSVADAEDSTTCEQFLIKMSEAIKSEKNIATDYISYSPLNNYKPLMNKTEIVQLTKILMAVKKHFFSIYGKGSINFYDFAVDVEFKLDKDSRKVYIKQARLY